MGVFISFVCTTNSIDFFFRFVLILIFHLILFHISIEFITWSSICFKSSKFFDFIQASNSIEFSNVIPQSKLQSWFRYRKKSSIKNFSLFTKVHSLLNNKLALNLHLRCLDQKKKRKLSIALINGNWWEKGKVLDAKNLLRFDGVPGVDRCTQN